MRVEYGSVEKDGSGDLDADWLADGWVALLRKWLADAEHAGEPSRTRWWSERSTSGKARDSRRVVQSVDETGISFFTNYDSAKGDGARGDPVRVGDVPMVPSDARCTCAGP